jgi:hypothetical protein
VSLLRSNADRIAWERTSSRNRITVAASVRLRVGGKFCRSKSCAILMVSVITRSEPMKQNARGTLIFWLVRLAYSSTRSTSIFMQSPISFAWLRTRPVRRPHWISNPYSLTDKSEAAADGRSWLPPWPQTRHLLPRRLRRPVGESVRPPAPAVDRFGSPCSFRQSAPCSRSPWSTAIIGWPLSSQWASLRPGWPRPSC